MAVKITKITILPENVSYPNTYMDDNDFNKISSYEKELAKENKLIAYTFEFFKEERKIIKNYFFSDLTQALSFYTSLLSNLEYMESHLSNLLFHKNTNSIVTWSIDYDCIIDQNHN